MIKLNERREEQAIVFGGHSIKDTIEIHDSAQLRMGEMGIWVTILSKTDEPGYIGEITDFENHDSATFSEMKIGSRIEFSIENIFICVS